MAIEPNTRPFGTGASNHVIRVAASCLKGKWAPEEEEEEEEEEPVVTSPVRDVTALFCESSPSSVATLCCDSF